MQTQTLPKQSKSNATSHFILTAVNPALQKYRDENRSNFVNGSWNAILQYHFDHVRQRVQERYGFHLTPYDWERMNWAVWREAKEYASFVGVKNPTTTIYDVTFTPEKGRNRTLRVYFNEELFVISTVLPNATPENGAWSDLLKDRRQIKYEYGAMLYGAEKIEGPTIIEPKTLPPPVVHAPQAVERVAAPASKDGLKVTGTNAASIATQLWDSFVGDDYDAKLEVCKIFISELRSVRDANKVRMVRAGLTTPKAADEAKAVAKVLGLTLSKLGFKTLPIMGVPMKVGQAFQIAEADGHPMQAACASFIHRHRLFLKSAPTGLNGKAPTILCQRDTA